MKITFVSLLTAISIAANAADQNAAGSRMSAEAEAEKNLFRISAALRESSANGLASKITVLRAAGISINAGEQAQVVSAEKVLFTESFSNQVHPRLLFTSAYLEAQCAIKADPVPTDILVKALKTHGAAFEMCIIPANQATNLGSFVWRTRGIGGSQDFAGFPFIWVKRPELYKGARLSRDVSGNAGHLHEAQFSTYLQGALDWFNRSRPLEAIDEMLAQTGDTDMVLNGLMLLRRHPNREFLLNRLERLVTSTNLVILGGVITELGELRDERAVAAIGKMIEKREISRLHLARALGKGGQAGAVRHLEKLLGPHPERVPRNVQARTRLEVVMALANIPTKEAREVLGRLAGDTDAGVSAAAKRALAADLPK